MPLWLGLSSKLSAGSIAGYMVGNFFKQITNKAILYLGCGVFLVGMLHGMQWITINFKKIDEDLLQLYVRAKTTAKDTGFF